MRLYSMDSTPSGPIREGGGGGEGGLPFCRAFLFGHQMPETTETFLGHPEPPPPAPSEIPLRLTMFMFRDYDLPLSANSRSGPDHSYFVAFNLL